MQVGTGQLGPIAPKAAALLAFAILGATPEARAEPAQAATPPKPTPPAAAAAPSFPARVVADYKVAFNGWDVGTFQFSSQLSGRSYTLNSSASLSALLGAFQWKGNSRSSGTVGTVTPRPAGYTFDFAGTGKSGSVKMSFSDAGVTNITALPPSNPSPGTVPVQDIHLKGVLDPLSAVLAVTRAGGNPCQRKIPIFDGKQRFDLVLSFRRQQRIAEAQPSGQPTVAFVCRVRYVPIAGYKMNDETKFMAANQGIEIALRPVPAANVLVPYQITIPTVAGSATLTSTRVSIQTSARRNIAFVY